ncbi:helix-turn-helix transcriptional regulator [Streptomyces sp. NPDC006367]|uniref:helix-turn-helix domain-containing protein n=1 Tax=unclassified Streptomyces TaxID=2593676 RepID=UPI0033BDF530
MTSHVPNEARVIALRPPAARPGERSDRRTDGPDAPVRPGRPAAGEPLWRDLVGDALRRERLAQERTLKDVAQAARISMPYLSEVERGRKEASSEVLAAAADALGISLAGLLARVQGELVRVTARHTGAGRVSRPSGARFDGMCLAA